MQALYIAAICLSLFLNSLPAAANDERPALRERYIRCAVLMGITGTSVVNRREGDAYTIASLTFARWASEIDEAAGMSRSVATEKSADDLAALVVRLIEQAKDRSTKESAVKEVLETYSYEAARCSATYRELNQKARPGG